MPLTRRSFGRTTAPTISGPAQAPRPTSSMPTTTSWPRSHSSFSIERVGARFLETLGRALAVTDVMDAAGGAEPGRFGVTAVIAAQIRASEPAPNEPTTRRGERVCATATRERAAVGRTATKVTDLGPAPAIGEDYDTAPFRFIMRVQMAGRMTVWKKATWTR